MLREPRLVQCPTVTILKFFIVFEQGPPVCFCLTLGLTRDVSVLPRVTRPRKMRTGRRGEERDPKGTVSVASRTNALGTANTQTVVPRSALAAQTWLLKGLLDLSHPQELPLRHSCPRTLTTSNVTQASSFRLPPV